jgi:hypothetical protein
VSPIVLQELEQIIVPDDIFGPKYHGSILSEYTQLFGLAGILEGSPKDERIYIFQYRKFLSLMKGSQLSSNMPYVYACLPEEGEKLFPSHLDLQGLMDEFVIGQPIQLNSMAHQYALSHRVEDFSAFIYSLSKINGFNERRCMDFIYSKMLLPAPSIGLFSIGAFLEHMHILQIVWEHFSSNFYVSREGYQRRVGGFLLERLHSFLILEEIECKRPVSIKQGYQIVISDSLEIVPTI